MSCPHTVLYELTVQFQYYVGGYHHAETVHKCAMEVSARRSLIALRTKAEVSAKLETITAYVVEIPVKAANRILKSV